MWFVAPGRASPPNLGPILANLRQVAKVRRNLARTDGVRVGCQGERGTSADFLSKQALAPTSPTSRQCTRSWKEWLCLTQGFFQTANNQQESGRAPRFHTEGVDRIPWDPGKRLCHRRP